MTFKEKIDKILSANKLGINSVSALEDKIGAGRGAINEFYNDNREPGRITSKKIKSLEGLNIDWYETGKGDIFIEYGTSVTEIDKKNTDRGEISILIKNLNRVGDFNEHLMKRVRDLEDFIKKNGLLPPA